MTRFWLTFARIGKPHSLNLGCGVTAFILGDAMQLVEAAFPDLALGSPLTVTEQIDVSTLDAGYVLPNIGDVLVRGIWWPRVS